MFLIDMLLWDSLKNIHARGAMKELHLTGLARFEFGITILLIVLACWQSIVFNVAMLVIAASIRFLFVRALLRHQRRAMLQTMTDRARLASPEPSETAHLAASEIKKPTTVPLQELKSKMY